MLTNSPKAWFFAARPKTLTGAAVPVAIALSLAYRDCAEGIMWIPAMLCLLFAFAMQIDANLINDYFDFVGGIDREDRLGPERACAQGWITKEAMLKGITATTVLSAFIGLPLIWWGGWQMILVGAVCIVFSFLYTTLLSRKALGDVLVLLFFGIVPVCTTYCIQAGTVSTQAVLLSIGCGLATDNLLVVNNFRDRDTDSKHGKTTLITIIGEKASLALYLILATTALALAIYVMDGMYDDSLKTNCILFTGTMAYATAVLHTWNRMRRILHGRPLNKVLGMTSMTILIYGITVCLWVILSIA